MKKKTKTKETLASRNSYVVKNKKEVKKMERRKISIECHRNAEFIKHFSVKSVVGKIPSETIQRKIVLGKIPTTSLKRDGTERGLNEYCKKI